MPTLSHLQRRWEDKIMGKPVSSESTYYTDTSQILAPLCLCYRSLKETGMSSVIILLSRLFLRATSLGAGVIADGRLLDLIRRLSCFGLSLVKLDLRQESDRHTEVLDAV